MTRRTDEKTKARLRNCGVKVHNLMCKELIILVDRISRILPTIESAQPGCSSGIGALCSLNLALDKAKLLIQHCSESSKFYLVITGDAIKLRCETIRNACRKSLRQIQSMVPLPLAAQISAIVGDLEDVNFIIEASDGEAGKAVLHLLNHALDSTEDSVLKAFQIASSRLQLASSKALLIEKRSIRKLLNKVCDTDLAKERILRYLLYLLERYGNSIGDQTMKCKSEEEGPDWYSVSSRDESVSKQSTHCVSLVTSQMSIDCLVSHQTMNCKSEEEGPDWYKVSCDDSLSKQSTHCVSLVTSQMSIDCLVPHPTTINSNRYQSPFKFSYGVESNTLPELSKLPWESQCRVIEEVRNTLNDNEDACISILCSSSVQAISIFLKDAFDRSDVKAQQVGAQVFLIFVTKSRNEFPSLYEDIFYHVVSFLDSEIVEEALTVIEAITGNQYCKSEVVTSGALSSILRILESQIRNVQEIAARILTNLSSESSIGSQIVRSGYVPKLISLLVDRSLSRHCISILKNLCITEEGRLAVGGSDNSIASIVEILESGSWEEQEQGVSIFLSLCSHSIEYCQVLLKEGAGAIQFLVTISINGNPKVKEIAMELLCILRDSKLDDSESSFPPTESIPEPPRVSVHHSNEKQSISKAPGYFKRKLNFFSRPRSLPLC